MKSAIGSGANARRPLLGAMKTTGKPLFAIIFVASTLSPFRMEVGSIQLEAHRILLLAVFVPFLFQLISGRVGRVLPVDILMLIAGSWCAFAYLLTSPDLGADWQFASVFFLEMFGGYLVGRLCITNAIEFQRFVRFFFVCVVALLPLAAFEAITHQNLIMESLGRYVRFELRMGLRRAYTVFDHPILFGTFVSASLGLVWHAYSLRASLFAKVLRSAVIGVATFLSLSTGALLAYLIQCAFMGYDYITKGIKRRWLLLTIGFVAFWVLLDIVATGSPPEVFIRYATFQQGSAYNRILIFEYGIDNIIDKPFFGFGSGTWIRAQWMPASIDNFWLSFAMQFGLPSFFALVAGTWLLVRNAAVAKLQDPLEQACRSGYLIGLSGLIIAGITVHYWQSMLSFVMFMFAAGAWIRPGNETAVAAAESEAPPAEAAGANAAAKKPKFVPYGRPRP